ncbi:hypothetical protein FGIG_11138 [Fasciola gigantica]|uniref:Uncharacterized protein n=1 Tax=Fasciola gigantica TaxID=46835 RepID=A0A504YM58_FASGI|nr:hypothetical protein FGIG_11138 [Fasciola gigantica]
MLEEPTTVSCYPQRKTLEIEFDGPEGQVSIHAHNNDDHEEVRSPFAEESIPQDAISFIKDPVLNEPRNCASFEWNNIQESICVGDGPVDEYDDKSELAQILQRCVASATPEDLPCPWLRSEFPTTVSVLLNFAPDLAQTVAFVEEKDKDSVRNFAVEETPFGTSTKTSSPSDPIISEHKGYTGELFAESLSGIEPNYHHHHYDH